MFIYTTADWLKNQEEEPANLNNILDRQLPPMFEPNMIEHIQINDCFKKSPELGS
jgi:hypothetical protein